MLKLKVENPKVFSFSRGIYSRSLCTLFHIKLFAASLQKSVDRNFGSRSSSLEVQQKLLNQSRWGGPVRNPGLVSARATDHGEQNQLLLTGEGNLRSRFPHGHWKEAWDCCVRTHTGKCAQEMKVLSHGSDTENTFKWGCCHAAHAQQGTGFSMTECALLFVFSALSLNDVTGRLLVGLAEGSWLYLSKREKWGSKVWLWCVDFGGCVLFFRKLLVTGYYGWKLG